MKLTRREKKIQKLIDQLKVVLKQGTSATNISLNLALNEGASDYVNISYNYNSPFITNSTGLGVSTNPTQWVTVGSADSLD